ncbi:Uncharacterised protein [Buttiauxella agrestis]|uniref:Uncharacterized protein n=1 Tax=Buttiauxella agrestis TaxID=82977 RepID=A0A381C525_9ENTR|nr:Uncharacterised protein [Buttiauxella agrestis]
MFADYCKAFVILLVLGAVFFITGLVSKVMATFVIGTILVVAFMRGCNS